MKQSCSCRPPVIGLQYFILTILLVLTHATSRADTSSPFMPTITITKTPERFNIDGNLTDPGWVTAARADGFVEVGPGDNIVPARNSRALITYGETHLYVALIAYDNPEEVYASLRERDNIFGDDYFGVLLGTYTDMSWGYELFVNPLGIQGDLKVTVDGNEDSGFDIVFESKGILTDSGYQVEMAIPFSSLRFPNSEAQDWRVQFWRTRPRNERFRYAWAGVDRDNPCWMCQWGYLKGIEGIAPSKNIDIIPAALSFQSGSLADAGDPRSAFDNDPLDADGSVNLRYGIASNASAEITVNPDFSQIESDAAQIDVNSTFGLYFSERRPFFQEGSELFSTWIDGVYTRTLNDPIVAGKLTRQVGRTAFAYLVGLDDASPVVIPLFEQSYQDLFGRSVTNVARVKQTIKNESYIGALMTNRQLAAHTPEGGSEEFGAGSGTVFGLDGRLKLTRNIQLEMQSLASYTDEPFAPDLIDTSADNGIGQTHFRSGKHTVSLDGESFWGAAQYVSLERSGRVWNLDIDFTDYTPTFRADNGFVTQNGYRRVGGWTGLFYRINKSLIKEYEPSISFGRIWNHEAQFTALGTDKGFKDEWVRPNLYLRFPGQTSFSTGYLISRERFGVDNTLFNGIRRYEASIDTRPSELLSFGFWFVTGTTIFRDRLAPELGDGLDGGIYGTIKPTQQLTISPSLNFSRLDHRDDYMDLNPGSGRNIFNGYILRTRLTYQFTRELTVRTILQYNDFSERFDFEPLVTYRVNPFTVFYVGMNSRYRNYDPGVYNAGTSEEYKLSDTEMRLSSRQLFAKFQYLVRL